MNKKQIAVIGASGFVGNAVVQGFINEKTDVFKIDPRIGTKISDLEGTKLEAVFVCVPTPMGENGKIDSSIVENVFSELNELSLGVPLVLKSTVLPNIVEKLSNQYEFLVYNPEFLTERNAVSDFQNPFLQVYGGDYEQCVKLDKVYQENSNVNFSNCKTKFMTAKEAAYVKYSVNSFLSLKVAFWNQMADIMGSSYGIVRNAVTEDNRIGISHTMVPGHDGRRGFGGACFYKDCSALLEEYGTEKLSILKEAWNYNVDVRTSYPELLPREIEQHVNLKKY